MILTATIMVALCMAHGIRGQGMDSDTYMEDTLMDAMKALSDSAMNSVMGILASTNVGDRATSRELPALPRLVDCFGLPAPLARVLRQLFKPSPPKVVNTRFFLVTRNNPKTRLEVKSGSEFSLKDTGFDPRRRTVIIVHGFMANSSMEWIDEMSEALLRKSDYNVFAVDWSGGGGSWRYWKAVANTRVTGQDLTRFVHNLMDAGLSTDNLHLIGHSLGAHICGFVSRLLGGVARITGLDPAEPCFRIKDPRMTLDKTDAAFVDVIHTNAQLWSKVALGLPFNIGHVDFYPNGGMHQPGCSTGRERSLLGRLLHISLDDITTAVCSHGRAYILFTESISSKRCLFWGHRWDGSRNTTDSSLTAPCDLTTCITMGMDTEDYPARGMFITKTDSFPPYCIREPKADEEMEAALFDKANFIPEDAN